MMKVWLYLLSFIVILFGVGSASAYADVDCSSISNPPTVFFVNGMRADKASAEKTRDKLKEVYFSFVNSLPNQSYVADEMRCVRFQAAHNQKEDAWLELLEVFLQSVPDDTTTFWQWIDMAAGISVPEWFREAQLNVTKTISTAFAYIVDEDLQQHVENYAGTLGRRLVIAHSQGNFYATEANLLLPSNLRVPVFAVATPESVDSYRGYLTYGSDEVINAIRNITGALPANAEGICGADDWSCHGMRETYLETSGQDIGRAIYEALSPVFPF